MCGSVDIVKMLLSSGGGGGSSSSSSSMVHCVDESGITPLHIAAIYGNVDCARALLAAGSDMAAQDEDCQSPLFLALSFGHVEVVRLLLEEGANMSVKDKYGASGAVVGVEEEEEDVVVVVVVVVAAVEGEEEVISTTVTLPLQASHAQHRTSTSLLYSSWPKRLQSAAHPSRHSTRLAVQGNSKSM